MSKQDKFFTKVRIGTNDTKLTAVNIVGTNLIIGDEKGTITTYEISDKKKLVKVNSANLKGKIDKILIPPNRKIAFVLSAGEIAFYNLPSLSYFKSLLKDKNASDIFINIDDPKCDNMVLVLNKKKRIKIYDFGYFQGNAVLNEQKKKDTISIEEIPNCAVWTVNNNFIYSFGNKVQWLDITSGKSTPVDYERTVQIINLGDKIALSNTEMTLFMKDGKAYQFNPITHVSYNGKDFQGYASFKNHLVALYRNALHIYKKGEQSYEFVESIDFGPDGNGKFLVTSNYKVIVCTETGGKFNILDFQDRLYQEQIKILVDQKLNDNDLEKLIENVSIKGQTPVKEMKFDLEENFEINSGDENFLLKIYINENLIFFEVEEKDMFPKMEFNIYLSLEELGKIDKFFRQFDSLKEVFDSLKTLIKKNTISIKKEEKAMKIKIVNPANDKEFFINIPLKDKDLKSEINSIIPYVISLKEKVEFLENEVNLLKQKLNEIYIYKNDFEEIKKEKELKKYEINKSDILNKNEIELLFSWLENKPKKITLLLNSKRDGDQTSTFYNLCSRKSPTIILVKTTKGHRFGGYSSIPWVDKGGSFSSDKNNFIFSLDKKKKYKIKNYERAIQTSSTYFAFGGGSDFYMGNNCTSFTGNYNNNSGTYETTEKYELNRGEYNYIVSSYEVYHIEY